MRSPTVAPSDRFARPHQAARRPRYHVQSDRIPPPGRDPGEDGSAVVEFVFLGVLLLIPLVYLVLTVGRLQAASYAVSTAAREAGRAYVTAPVGAAPAQRARAAAELAFADQGFAGGHIQVRCPAAACLTPESRVEVDADLDVPLPLIPAVAEDVVPTSVRISGTYGVTVDRFRGQQP